MRRNLIAAFDDVIDVLVHVDPEDDEFIELPADLMSRAEVRKHLQSALGERYEDVDSFTLHYLDGLVEVEVALPHLLGSQPERIELIKKRCTTLQQSLNTVAKVDVYLKQ